MASSPPRPWMVLDPEVPLSRSPPAVAAKAAPVERANMSISVVAMVAILLISLVPFLGSFVMLLEWFSCYLSSPLRSITSLSCCYRSSSLHAHTVPPPKATNHAQHPHSTHTAPFVWVPCGCGGGNAAPEGNGFDRGASKTGLGPPPRGRGLHQGPQR